MLPFRSIAVHVKRLNTTRETEKKKERKTSEEMERTWNMNVCHLTWKRVDVERRTLIIAPRSICFRNGKQANYHHEYIVLLIIILFLSIAFLVHFSLLKCETQLLWTHKFKPLLCFETRKKGNSHFNATRINIKHSWDIMAL